MSATSPKVSVGTAPSRRSIATGSTDFEATGGNVIACLPISAETQTMGSDIRFARLEDFWTALMKNRADAVATTGTVKCLFAEGKGKSWVYESLTLRLNTAAFRPTPFGESVEEVIPNILCAPASGFIVVNVAGLDTTAPPIVHSPGLLNSTDRFQGASRLVESKFAEAVALAGKEWFEDGVESEFSRALSTLLHTYKGTALAPVETFFASPSTNVEVAVEAARWLGRVDHPTSHRYRRTLLEKVLMSTPSTRLRHGAASGLAAMDDASSLLMVMEARDRETNQRLRRFLQLVVDQLERTRACRSS